MLARIVCSLLLAPLCTCGQFSENFNLGGIRDLPAWQGPDSAWTLKDGMLQSASTRTNAAFYLSRSATAPPAAQWEWWMKADFNTSSTNYVDVFMEADAVDLNKASGYFVRIGNTQDEVSLYHKPPGAPAVKIIDGRDGITGQSSNTLEIKVTRSESGAWQLFTRPPGGVFVSEGKAQHVQSGTSAYFGILVRQSTASFFGRHYFDNIICSSFNRDTTAPAVTQLEVRDAHHIFVLFSEMTGPLSPENFSLGNNVGHPDQVQRDPVLPGYHIYYGRPFSSGQPFTFHMADVGDEADNIMAGFDTTLVYYLPVRYDMIISEIFADPSPVTGLPAYEYVELYNRTPYPIGLNGWQLQAGSSQVSLPPYYVPGGGRLIVCAPAAKAAFEGWGTVLAVSGFPSLGNEQDRLALYDQYGGVMHAVAYAKSWYGNKLKEDGGWSLEMISPDAACSGQVNWKASIAAAGGTPGRVNSVAGNITDDVPPAISLVAMPDSLHVRLDFDRTLDSVAVSLPSNYNIQPGNIHPVSVTIEPPMLQTVVLTLPAALQHQQLYQLDMQGIKGCNGVTGENQVAFGSPESPVPGDVVINEVLFNPPSGVTDFVELYNRGTKVIDLAGLYLANRKTDGSIDNIVRVSVSGRQLLPAHWLALTEMKDALCRSYACKSMADVLELPAFPSYPDNEGTVVLLNGQGAVLDEFYYNEKLHFPLISNRDGISLERLDVDQPAGDVVNWYSASSVAGFATPGYANSQQSGKRVMAGSLSVQPEVFSPDNDGRDDQAFISYNFTSPGKVANITVFDAAGRPVRSLVRSQLLGNAGRFNWDGLSDEKQALRPGFYVIFAEIFDPAGKVDRWKIPLVLAQSYSQ